MHAGGADASGDLVTQHKSATPIVNEYRDTATMRNGQIGLIVAVEIANRQGTDVIADDEIGGGVQLAIAIAIIDGQPRAIGDG